jgi:hypothetical protein
VTDLRWPSRATHTMGIEVASCWRQSPSHGLSSEGCTSSFAWLCPGDYEAMDSPTVGPSQGPLPSPAPAASLDPAMTFPRISSLHTPSYLVLSPTHTTGHIQPGCFWATESALSFSSSQLGLVQPLQIPLASGLSSGDLACPALLPVLASLQAPRQRLPETSTHPPSLQYPHICVPPTVHRVQALHVKLFFPPSQSEATHLSASGTLGTGEHLHLVAAA